MGTAGGQGHWLSTLLVAVRAFPGSVPRPSEPGHTDIKARGVYADASDGTITTGLWSSQLSLPPRPA